MLLKFAKSGLDLISISKLDFRYISLEISYDKI